MPKTYPDGVTLPDLIIFDEAAEVPPSAWVPPHPIECEGQACRVCGALDHQPCAAQHPGCLRHKGE